MFKIISATSKMLFVHNFYTETFLWNILLRVCLKVWYLRDTFLICSGPKSPPNPTVNLNKSYVESRKMWQFCVLHQGESSLWTEVVPLEFQTASMQSDCQRTHVGRTMFFTYLLWEGQLLAVADSSATCSGNSSTHFNILQSFHSDRMIYYWGHAGW